jgi:hypothetical protein
VGLVSVPRISSNPKKKLRCSEQSIDGGLSVSSLATRMEEMGGDTRFCIFILLSHSAAGGCYQLASQYLRSTVQALRLIYT